jgi:hypothetical protein
VKPLDFEEKDARTEISDILQPTLGYYSGKKSGAIHGRISSDGSS